MKVKSESEVAQSFLTLSDPMDCSPPGSSVHGTFQARVLEWGATTFSGLKALHSENQDHSIWSHHFMANRWENSGNGGRLHFLGFQNHCRWALQPWNEKTLAPWRISYDQLDNTLKSRDITLPTKFRLVKAIVFPVIMYGCESWPIKKVELWRIDALELWCWRRFLIVFGLQGDTISPS